MSSEEHDLVVRRILVALDASPHSAAALEAAAELASRLQAEVLGVYVEDVNLLRLAELPFTEEVCLPTTARRHLGIREIERQFRAQAVRMRRTLARHAERAHVRWSFQVTRGVISTELLTAAGEVDLITLGRAGRSFGESGLGSTARVVCAEAPCLTLIIQQGEHLSLPVMVVYDGSPLAQKALTAATSLVRGLDSHLIVFLLAATAERAETLKAQVSQWLRDRDLMARYRVLTQSSVPRLARLTQMERGGTLVVPAESPLLRCEVLIELLDRIQVPVLLVR